MTLPNIVPNAQGSLSGFTGTGNIIIGQDLSTLNPSTSNTLLMSVDGQSSILLGDLKNRNLVLGSASLTGPSFGSAQGVTFLPTSTSLPSTGMTGGIGLYSDGHNLLLANASGQNFLSNLRVYGNTGSNPTGTILNPKIWAGTGATNSSGVATIDISSASFNKISSAQATASLNTSSAITCPIASIQTLSTTSCVINVVEGTTAVLAGATLTFAPGGTLVYLMVMGS